LRAGDLARNVGVPLVRPCMLRGLPIPTTSLLEMVLTAAMTREHPHLADDWTPERAAEQRYARLQRYLENGR
jgi:hypothetical protein